MQGDHRSRCYVTHDFNGPNLGAETVRETPWSQGRASLGPDTNQKPPTTTPWEYEHVGMVARWLCAARWVPSQFHAAPIGAEIGGGARARQRTLQ